MSTDYLMEADVDRELTGFGRTVLVTVMLLIGATLGWIAPKIHRALSEDGAVAALQEMGAIVRYDYQLDGSGEMLPDAQPPGWSWVRSMVGNSYYARVADVDLSLTYLMPPYLEPDDLDEQSKARINRLAKFDDSQMVHIAHLTKLETLRLGDTRVTNTGLAHLRGLGNLKTLWLDGTGVDDGGLIYVSRLKSLENLYLSRTRVTDAGLEYVARLVELKQLHVKNTRVTGAGVFALGQILPSCTVNNVPDTFESER